MKWTRKLALASALLVILAGCGGGGLSDLIGGGAQRHGAIYSSWNGYCGALAAGIVANASSQSEAKTAAYDQCVAAGGTECSFRATFGSAYQGDVDCGALAFDKNHPSDGSCLAVAGWGKLAVRGGRGTRC